MHHTTNASQSQDTIKINSQIDAFFKAFTIGSLLDRAGIRKRHGYRVCSLIKTIFTLPFIGKNFFRGIVINEDVDFGKDAAYQVLKCERYNWRKLVLALAVKLHGFFNHLTDEDRKNVLIIDDSTYDRSRSKLVELLCRVKDHSTGRYLTGFRMLTMCWSDGVSCLPIDFALLSSSNAKSRLQDIRKCLDKRTCGYRRRVEAMEKATAHLETMVKRALAAGIKAKYVLMDSWFGMPATIAKLAAHLDVICMVKKTPKVHYLYDNQRLDLVNIYKRLKKRRGRAKIKASVVVALTDGTPAKLVFVRDSRKSDWLALLSTDISLADDKIVQTYGKRWDIGVSSKGHIIQSVRVRPGLKDSDPVAWEVPWRESKMVKPSDRLFRKEMMQGFRPQRAVNADVASLHVTPVAETVYNARRQQESLEMSLIRRLSPAGYQRWHVAKDYVSTGEALGARRRNLAEEAAPITVSGKWGRRHQGGGLGRSTCDRCAAKRTRRKGPRPVIVPFGRSEAGVR